MTVDEGESNIEVIRATAQNGVTGRTQFSGDSGIIGGGLCARSVEVFNNNPAGGSDVRIKFNLDTGNIGTQYRTIRPGGSQSIDALIRNVAYVGVGGNALLEITYTW